MGEKKACGQVNIPSVDNSSPCDRFFSSDCILITVGSSKTGTEEGDPLTKLIEGITNKFAQLDNKIYLLNDEINYLKSKLGE